MQNARTALLVILLVLLAGACNLDPGTDPGSTDGSNTGSTDSGDSDSGDSGSDTSDDGGPSAQDQFRSVVQDEAGGISTDPTAEAVYNAGAAIKEAQTTYDIDLSTLIEILEAEVDDPELRDLLLLVIDNGYTLQDIQSFMDGVSSNPEEGITAALSLDENIDADSTAQLNGDVDWTEGIDGSGLRFDAEGEYVSLPDSSSLDLLSEEATIEVWIYPEQNITAAGIIHKGTEPDFSDESYSLQYNSPGEVAMIFTNEAGKYTYVISDEPHLAEDQWHHIVISWNMSEVWMYIDGAAVTSLRYYQNGWKSSLPADFAPIRDSDGDLMIGSQPVAGYRFEGIIDNVVLYDRVLPADEVAANYSALIH